MTRDLLPGRAFVSRNIKAASGSAAVSSPRVNLKRPHPGEKSARIVWIHHQIRAAGVFICEQDAIPMRTTVSRAKDTALLLRTVRVTNSTSDNDVRILWIDYEVTDPTGLFETHQLPGLAGVR